MSFLKNIIQTIRPSESDEEEKRPSPFSGGDSVKVVYDEALHGAKPESERAKEILSSASAEQELKLMLIDLAIIEPNPFQPRRSFNNDRLVELAASISEHGVIHPIAVREHGDGYQIISGERRCRAATLAGLTVIPAIIYEVSDIHMAVLSMMENLQREELSVIEEAVGYARILSEFSMTQEQLAKELGRSQSGIANKLRLLRLPAQIQEALGGTIISERHARALLRLPTVDMQLMAYEEILREGMSVRQCEDWIADILGKAEAENNAAAEDTGKNERPRSKINRFIPKDLIIFLNEFSSVVKTMQQAGIKAELTQSEEEEFWEVRVRIKKT